MDGSVTPDPLNTGNSPKSSPFPNYTILRWTIRLTGMLLMVGGTVYFLATLGGLLFGALPFEHGWDLIYILIVSVLAAVFGLFACRVGWKMLWSIDSTTISIFSFIFALIYTFILIDLLPRLVLFQDNADLMVVFPFVYSGLTYLVVKKILSALLLPEI